MTIKPDVGKLKHMEIPIRSGKGLVAKRILQTVAIVIGLIGIGMILTGLWGGLLCISREKPAAIIEFFTVIVMAALVLLGFGMTTVAYQAIRDFNPAVIKNVIGLLTFILWNCLFSLFKPWLEAPRGTPEETLFLLSFPLSILIAIQAYRVTSRRLIKLTENETVQ